MLYGATQLKIETSELSVSRQLVQFDTVAANVPSISNLPESDILEATADQLLVVLRAKLELHNIELGHMLCKNLSLLPSVDPRYVPHNDHLLRVDHFFLVALFVAFSAHTGQEATVGGK